MTPCRFAPDSYRDVPLKGNQFGVLDEFIEVLRINPPLGGREGKKG